MLFRSPDDYPLASVIVPCYKTTAYVGETLDSFRAQTYRSFEIIVVNDGCPDTQNLERVLAPYMSEIVYIYQDNQGLAGALNKGIRASRAPLVAFIGADDRWKPNYLSAQIDYLKQHPDIDVAYANAVYFGSTTWAGRRFMDMYPRVGVPTVASLVNGCPIPAHVTIRRQACLNVGMFDPELRCGGEDLDLWLRLIKEGYRFGYNDQVLIEYRIRAGSLSNCPLKTAKAFSIVLNKLLQRPDLTQEERLAASSALQKQEANANLALGKKAVFARARSEAIFHLVEANRVLRDRRISAMIIALRVAPWLLFRRVHLRYATEYHFLHSITRGIGAKLGAGMTPDDTSP